MFLRALPRVAVPVLVLGAVEALCLFGPVPAALLSPSPGARYVAPAALGLALLLGLVFHQHRVSGLALMCLAAMGIFLSGPPPGAALQVTCVLFSVFAPICAVFLHWTPEGKLVTGYSALRLSVPALAALLLFGIPRLVDTARLLAAVPALAGPGLPPVGLLLLVVSAPLLCLSQRHESPILGLFLLASLAMVAIAIDMLCRGAGSRSVLVVQAGFTAGATALAWGILDSAWWHANIDELTQLPGRRLLKTEMSSLRGAYTIAVVDVDHFKRVNDRHGHDVGDQVLRYLSARLRTCPGASAYRQGGEEFALVFPRGPYEEHLAALEALRRAIAEKRFVKRGPGRPRRKPRKRGRSARRSDTIGLTVSIGAAHSGNRFPTPEEVHAMADKALYRAKRAGRNRVSRMMK